MHDEQWFTTKKRNKIQSCVRDWKMENFDLTPLVCRRGFFTHLCLEMSQRRKESELSSRWKNWIQNSAQNNIRQGYLYAVVTYHPKRRRKPVQCSAVQFVIFHRTIQTKLEITVKEKKAFSSVRQRWWWWPLHVRAAAATTIEGEQE